MPDNEKSIASKLSKLYKAQITNLETSLSSEKAKNKKLLAIINNQQRKINELLTIEPTTITFEKFLYTYLIARYDAKDMPKAAGIYAYYNKEKSLLYIGQSVNMYKRLQSHFRGGKVKVSGHDSEFKNNEDWSYYVLDLVLEPDKAKRKILLDNREAYWLAQAKLATTDRAVSNGADVSEFDKLLRGELMNTLPVISTVVKSTGDLTNRTRGNNIKL